MAGLRQRKDVWKLKEWDPILLWYAKAIGKMQTRPIKDPTSWRFQAAVHDYIAGQDPLAKPGDVLPSKADQKTFWKQCQHNSWFFLPWHRIYLFFFEQMIADAVVELGGPAGWALPYWNYSDTKNPDARRLPPAFRELKLPDGTPNPLHVADRDEGNDGGLVGDPSDTDLSCLKDPVYTADPIGGDPGFGGQKTRFHHSGGVVGRLEATPHGSMHVAVGGWMGAFNTAGLDPIFWLHHSNIDRLWNVWRKRAAHDVNPTDAQWLTGVAFQFHDSKAKVVSFTAAQVADSTAAPLSYNYEDESDPFGGVPAPQVVSRLAMAERPIPEMVGATTQPVTLTGDVAHSEVPVKTPSGPAREARAAAAAPQKVYLNLENITGSGKPERYSVYLNLPQDTDPASHPELHAGDLPMFGVVESSTADENHSGSGLHYSLDVTDVVHSLEAKGQWNPANLRVSFVPKRKGRATHRIEVGRVSLYYA